MSVHIKHSRPHMPGYGVVAANEGAGLLPWDFITERMVAAHNYWVGSARPDGRPHVAPVWGLWHEDAFYFSSGRDSRKALNFAANPAAVVHLESGDETVILEGVIETLDEKKDAVLLKALDKAYKAKYKFPMVGMGNIYKLQTKRALAWREADFPSNATRWIFD